MGGRLSSTLHAVRLGGCSAEGTRSGSPAPVPGPQRGAATSGGGCKPRRRRPSLRAPRSSREVISRSNCSVTGRRPGSQPPRRPLQGLLSEAWGPHHSAPGHFHPAPSPRAPTHLFSISLEAEANPGLAATGSRSAARARTAANPRAPRLIPARRAPDTRELVRDSRTTSRSDDSRPQLEDAPVPAGSVFRSTAENSSSAFSSPVM